MEYLDSYAGSFIRLCNFQTSAHFVDCRRNGYKKATVHVSMFNQRVYLEAESFIQFQSAHKMASLEFPNKSTAQILIHWAIAQQIIEWPLI